MSRFTYTAEKADGEVYKGVAEARDRFDLYTIVRREGGRIIGVDESKSRDLLSLSYWNSKLTTVSEYERILLARNLGAMLSAGLALSRALAVLERQTRNAKLSNVVSQLASEVRRGDPLHTALSKFPNIFSKLFVAMVRSGEEGGDLPQSLSVIADQMERMYNLKKKVRGALIYPAIVLGAIVGIGVLMMIKVVPTLAQTFAEMGAELPASTQTIIAISNFLVRYTILAAALFIFIVGSIYFAVKTPVGGRVLDFIFLKLPLIGKLVREVNAARTSRTLSSLLSSGVDMLTSLDITTEVIQNSYFKEVVQIAKASVGKGEPLSAAFTRREDLYPAFVGEMMSVGEETGQLTEMMKRLAIYYEDEVDRQTKDMSTVIEPFLMVFIGGAVGFFAVSMISPIYSLSQAI
ncbi:type II secretion system F family protein [Candidatus Kaiserbacteria bacterium]|nr:type II secretion system F family protein [Candidatus Kaiserbacteria bacterium]